MVKLTEKLILDYGYSNPRQLTDGRWLATYRFAYTTGLLVGLAEMGYEDRFCYERTQDAEKACRSWDGVGFPPGPWIKRKGISGEMTNPEWEGFREGIDNVDR